MNGSYSTGEVAKICKVAPRTVQKWIDSGMLKGFLIPGTKHRRVAPADLLAFMHAHELDALIIDAGLQVPAA